MTEQTAAGVVMYPDRMIAYERGRGAKTIPLVTPHIGARGFLNGMTIFKPGAAIPLHTHNCEESVLLLEGHAPREARAAAAGWLDRVGLDVPPTALPSDLSGGQAQLAAAARALVAGPLLLLADEPTASLDTATGRQLLDLLVTTTTQAGGSVVLVSHDNAVAARADREVRLRQGSVVHEVALS